MRGSTFERAVATPAGASAPTGLLIGSGWVAGSAKVPPERRPPAIVDHVASWYFAFTVPCSDQCSAYWPAVLSRRAPERPAMQIILYFQPYTREPISSSS